MARMRGAGGAEEEAMIYGLVPAAHAIPRAGRLQLLRAARTTGPAEAE